MINEEVDMIFLDIDICNETILNLMKNYLQTKTQIIYITSYYNYMIKAFKLSSVNILIKPICENKLHGIINKLNNQKNISYLNNSTDNNHNIYSSINKIVGIRQSRIFLIKLNEIIYISAEEGGVSICDVNNLSYKNKNTLKYWENKLKYNGYFRCHRSFLVNAKKVKEIVPSYNSTFSLEFEVTSKTVPVGRKYISSFKEYIGF